jgi:Replication-relaxation
MEKILFALADFEYLTADQLTRLLYSAGSLTYVKAKLKGLIADDFILAVGGRRLNLPRVYTLTAKGRQFTTVLGKQPQLRFRPGEIHQKAYNLFFMRHTLAVIDVLISARLLTQTVPGIVLNNMFQERELRRKIYVPIPQDKEKPRTICLEPDASLDFTIQQAWRDFFHIEFYRHLPMEHRFKQKIHGYLTYAESSQHQELFHTAALSIAILAATEQLSRTLKGWTEDVLTKLAKPAEGQRFFFSSVVPAHVSPAALFLSPVWELGFRQTQTPLLLLAEEGHER